MIGLKSAIKVAKDFIYEIYEREEDLLLESASLNKDENIWYISFSLPRKFEPVNNLQVTLGLDRRVVYKTIKVDQEGEVLGMVMGVPNYESENREIEQSQLEPA